MHNKKKKNILIVEPYAFSRGGGNILTQSFIIRFSDKERFNLYLLTPFETEFTRTAEKLGADIIVAALPYQLNMHGGKYNNIGIIGKIKTAWALLQYNLRLIKIIKKNKIDVIYCNNIRSFLYSGLSSLTTGVPIFLYIKGELENPLLDILAFLFSKRIVFISRSNISDKYRFWGKLLRNKIDCVENGIDINEIKMVESQDLSGLAETLNIQSGRVNLICLGFVYPLKGIHYLLEALTIIKNIYPDFTLYIVGDIPLEKWEGYKVGIQDYVKENGLSDHVVFAGWQDNALGVLSAMDILIHPSTSEGFPAVILEAMAFGKPVVATRVGGARDLIEDGRNGFLVHPESPSGIAEKLKILLQDSEKRTAIGVEGRKTVFSNYRIDRQVARIEEIWDKM